MTARVAFIFLLVSTLRAEVAGSYVEASSKQRTLRNKGETPAACNMLSKEYHSLSQFNDKHTELTSALDASFPSLNRFFHMTSYQIPEVIENFSVIKTISGCTCAVKDETAVCNELHMKQIPVCVRNTTVAAILISRTISGINAGTFKYTPNLEYLNITRVDLRLKLPSSVFSGLSKLKYLAIQDHGSMPELPEDIFEELGRLEGLYLYNNGLQFLPPNIFSQLRKLRTLNLANNHLRRLPAGIFDKNLELRELVLSGNHFKDHYNPNLLSHNLELRVLLFKDTHSSEIDVNLLGNATKLRWLDLSDNYLRQLPVEALKYCQKLNHLSLKGNRFEKLDAELLLQHYTELQRLDLRGNEWNCNCDIMPLAGWALVHDKTVAGMPVCQQPSTVAGITLQEWFCHYGNMCIDYDLKKDLGEFIGLTEAIADIRDYTESANISHFVTNCFFFGMSSEMGSSIDLILRRFAHLLGNVFQKKYDRAINSSRVASEIDHVQLARQEPTLKFTYIFQTISENMQAAVNAGLEAEIASIFDSGTDQEITGADADLVIGLRHEIRRIFSVLQNCSFPLVIETEMVTAYYSSSVIVLPYISLYCYFAALVTWSY